MVEGVGLELRPRSLGPTSAHSVVPGDTPSEVAEVPWGKTVAYLEAHHEAASLHLLRHPQPSKSFDQLARVVKLAAAHDYLGPVILYSLELVEVFLAGTCNK